MSDDQKMEAVNQSSLPICFVKPYLDDSLLTEHKLGFNFYMKEMSLSTSNYQRILFELIVKSMQNN